MPSMLAAGRGPAATHEEMGWGWNMSDQDHYLLPFVYAPFQVQCISTAVAYSMRTRFQRRLRRFRLTQGCDVTHPSRQDIPLQMSVDNASPRHDGACSPQQSLSTYGESRGKGCLLQFLTFTVLGTLAVVSSLAYGLSRLVIQMY